MEVPKILAAVDSSVQLNKTKSEMDSPPSCSLSTGPLSDLGSSGLGGSISSDSVRAHLAMEMQESDIESKSLSQDSFDYSDGMCGENFNTLKKGPGWSDTDGKLEVDVAIKPPPEFQDSPSPPDSESSSAPILNYARLMRQIPHWMDDYAGSLVQSVVEEALVISCRISWPEGRIAPTANLIPVVTRIQQSNPKHMWDLIVPPVCQSAATITITPYSILNRPNSRCSLASSRLSSSHNSINTTGLSHKADDSSFITSAMSHDVLTTSEISDMYNVPFDSDIYTVPIDVVRPLHDLRAPQRPKRHRHHRKRRRNVSASSQSELEAHIQQARHYCGKSRAITHVTKLQRLLAKVCCNDGNIGARVGNDEGERGDEGESGDRGAGGDGGGGISTSARAGAGIGTGGGDAGSTGPGGEGGGGGSDASAGGEGGGGRSGTGSNNGDGVSCRGAGDDGSGSIGCGIDGSCIGGGVDIVIGIGGGISNGSGADGGNGDGGGSNSSRDGGGVTLNRDDNSDGSDGGGDVVGSGVEGGRVGGSDGTGCGNVNERDGGCALGGSGGVVAGVAGGRTGDLVGGYGGNSCVGGCSDSGGGGDVGGGGDSNSAGGGCGGGGSSDGNGASNDGDGGGNNDNSSGDGGSDVGGDDGGGDGGGGRSRGDGNGDNGNVEDNDDGGCSGGVGVVSDGDDGSNGNGGGNVIIGGTGIAGCAGGTGSVVGGNGGGGGGGGGRVGRCGGSSGCGVGSGKRHSVPSTSSRYGVKTSNGHAHNIGEPIHMTLHEVRQYLQTLYSSSSDSSENKIKRDKAPLLGHTSVHLTATPKVLTVNNNNRYNNNTHTDSFANTPVSNKSTSNGRIIYHHNNNNNNNNNNHNNNNGNNAKKHKRNTFVSMRHKKVRDESYKEKSESEREKIKKSQRNFSLNLKQTLCNIFRFRRLGSPDHFMEKRNSIVHGEVVEEEETGVDSDQHATNNYNAASETEQSAQKLPFFKRALPPLPKSTNSQVGVEQAEEALTAMVPKCESPSPVQQVPLPVARGLEEDVVEDTSMDFAASIEKVKDYGWYWGPISGEAAEKILSNEPDGSFIVRDSSDDHYIFSLSFRLNSCVRHVRIEHDQGNFSFGSCTKFKSHTIVDFIENAVEHSRSGRYLFFLHRRPVLGPMRVQLLHPVSRFKQVQSLQHTCRFVILKMVRRDLIPTLPLPRRLIDYLSTPHYYSEQLAAEQDDRAESPVSSSTGELEKICFTPQGLS